MNALTPKLTPGELARATGRPQLVPSLDASAIKGEAKTGFEKAGELGPFKCGNCTYYDTGWCTQKDMKAYSKQPRAPSGVVAVDASDCCEFINRAGRT